jgi:hypothetical protein
MSVQISAVGADDAAAFLAAMLKRVKTEIGQVGRFGVAEDPEDTAFIM